MAKHFTDQDIEQIVGLIDGCQDKLTWDWLCDRCTETIGRKPTRQALSRYARIKTAFNHKKKRLKNGLVEIKTPPSLKVAGQRIKRLEEVNARLKKENDLLLEQFVIWQYNAYLHGLTEDNLNNPLPSIDRGSSESE